MDKQTKIILTVGLGVAGIGASTLWLAPAGMPFWAEAAKWAPGVLVTVFAFLAAENSKDEARGSREAGERAEVEAKEGRAAGQRAEQEARSGRERAEQAERAAMAKGREKRKLRKASGR